MSAVATSMTVAVSPALAPGKAAPYVIAAYIVFLAIVLIYVVIMARRLTKTEDDLAKLKRDMERGGSPEARVDPHDEERRSESHDLEPVP